MGAYPYSSYATNDDRVRIAGGPDASPAHVERWYAETYAPDLSTFKLRCDRCGYVGDRVFMADPTGTLRDVLGGANGVTPGSCECQCGSSDLTPVVERPEFTEEVMLRVMPGTPEDVIAAAARHVVERELAAVEGYVYHSIHREE